HRLRRKARAGFRQGRGLAHDPEKHAPATTRRVCSGFPKRSFANSKLSGTRSGRAKLPRREAVKLSEGPGRMCGVGKAALQRQAGDGDMGKRGVAEQLPELSCADAEHVPLERRFTIGKDAMQAPLRDAEFCGERRWGAKV